MRAVSALKIPFPRKRRQRGRKLGSNAWVRALEGRACDHSVGSSQSQVSSGDFASSINLKNILCVVAVIANQQDQSALPPYPNARFPS